MEEKKTRIAYYDYLRVFATYAVILAHVSAKSWDQVAVTSAQYQLLNLYECLLRWCVPIFVMISGAIFLGRPVNIKNLYKKSVLRMVTAYLIWGLLYSITTPLLAGTPIYPSGIIDGVINGHYHMWFLPMIVGLYIAVPILYDFAQNDKLLKYAIAAGLVIAFVIPQAVVMIVDFLPNTAIYRYALEAYQTMDEYMETPFSAGYLCYFLTGYYLSRHDLDEKKRKTVYIAGILAFAAQLVCSIAAALRNGTSNGSYYGELTISVYIEAVALFVLLKQIVHQDAKPNALFKKLSDYSFGAYLVHALVIELIEHFTSWNVPTLTSVALVPLLSLLVFILAMGISALLHCLPKLSRYIV